MHTPMANGLGLYVDGIETEAVMQGMSATLTLLEMFGCELTGSTNPLAVQMLS